MTSIPMYVLNLHSFLFKRVDGDNTAVGRPPIEVQKEELQNLRALNFRGLRYLRYWESRVRHFIDDWRTTIYPAVITAQSHLLN